MADILQTSLQANIDKFKEDFGQANDLLIREITLTDKKQTKVAILGIDGLVNLPVAQQFVMHVLTIDLSMIDDSLPNKADKIFDLLLNSRISMMDAKHSEKVSDLYNHVLTGHIAILIDGVARAMCFDCKGWQTRGISEPSTEKSIRGPKDSFVETVRFNTALLRRRVKDSRLRFDAHQVGSRSKLDVFVAYIDGITNPEFVKTVNDRIKNIDVDNVTSTSEMQRYLEDEHHTLVPRLVQTERPDRVAHALTEGQVAIFVDGSPYVILGPFYFTSAFQTVDDYHNPPLFSTIKRLFRCLAFFSVILIPGFYIALTTFHQEMIPSSLLITLINQRAANPFSTFVEILIIVVLFEILKESSLRKPSVIGDSMTIAGSLIIGQTIVESGLVSYTAIIVGALSTIFSFLLSNTTMNVSARIFKIVFMIIGSTFGFYGIALGFIILITHLASITSLNQAYLAPMAPFNLKDQKDQLLKLPAKFMKERPKVYQTVDNVKANFEKD